MARSTGVRHGTSLKISMLGTRGVPAAYGGFETAVDEIGRRLVGRGHRVVVYCRTAPGTSRDSYLGMKLVHLPAIRFKAVETLSHTFLSALHALLHPKPDVAFVFNAANAPFLPLVALRNVPVAVHVDGLEWKRGKWGRLGRAYYRRAEALSVRWADALIADAEGISKYYQERFDAPTELLSYGTHILADLPDERIRALGLDRNAYHLVVARFEPENHVDLIVTGYSASSARFPLVVVGSAPYSASYTSRIQSVADSDPRIVLLGGVWDGLLLDQLYAHAYSYIHGHSVGGTNPSLLRAMGAGTATIAFDVNFNRDVLGHEAKYFSSVSTVRACIESAESDGAEQFRAGASLQERAAEYYNWDAVAAGYEDLAYRLARQTVR